MGIINAKITNLTIETARIEPLLPIQEEIQEVVIKMSKKETQLDRLENKMDRILHLLESGDLPISFEKVFVEVSKKINEDFTRFLRSRGTS